MPNHVLRDSYIEVVLPIVYLELEAHKIGQDGCRACLGLDRGNSFAVLWPYNGQGQDVGSLPR